MQNTLTRIWRFTASKVFYKARRLLLADDVLFFWRREVLLIVIIYIILIGVVIKSIRLPT